MIFANRKKDVDSLHRSLQRHGFNAVRMQGDMAQHEREVALAAFRNGDTGILVCTDVVGRGIDVFGVSHVFCYDVPVHAEDYVHRIGRTGRAGHRGRAVMLATPEDAKAVQAVTRLIRRDLPRLELDGIEQWAQPDVDEPADGATRDEAAQTRGGRTRSRRRRRGTAARETAPTPAVAASAHEIPAHDGVAQNSAPGNGGHSTPFGQDPRVPAFLLRPTFAEQDADAR